MSLTKDDDAVTEAENTPDQAESRSSRASLPSAPEGEWLIGTLAEIDEQGRPLVRVALDDQWHTLATTPVISVGRSDLGRQSVVMLPGASFKAPLLMGFVHTPLTMALSQTESPGGESFVDEPTSYLVGVDEKPAREVLLEGKEKVVLRCGAASITLTEAGKIILRGEHLVSRSQGVNRILGASIQMN